MNDKNQNTSPEPDYEFILNQGSQVQESGPLHKKKANKKVIVLVVLVLLLIPVFGVSIFFSASQNVQQGSIEQDTATTQQNVTTPTIVEEYVNNLKRKNYSAAYAVFDVPDKPTEDHFKEVWETYLRGNYDIDACYIQGAVLEGTITKTTVICPALHYEGDITFIYKTNQEASKIVDFDINEGIQQNNV